MTHTSYKRFLALFAIACTFVVVGTFFSAKNVQAAGNTIAPTLLAPQAQVRMGQDRVWVGGVAKNNQRIVIHVDGVRYAEGGVKNHVSGTGSFGIQLNDLSFGEHVVTAVALDQYGSGSIHSNALTITVLPKTPTPILYKPLVNADSGIERPFITGLVKSNLSVVVVVNDRVVATLEPLSSTSGTARFSYQPENRWQLGTYKIEVFASDNGKLSNNSAPVYWQVGSLEAQEEARMRVEDDKQTTEKSAENPVSGVIDAPAAGVGGTDIVQVDDSSTSTEKVAVRAPANEVAPSEEKPIVPDVRTDDENSANTGVITEDSEVIETSIPAGRVVADDEVGDYLAEANPNNTVTQLAPNAVVRNIETQSVPKRVNTSLIVGILILVFLLISIIVWYIQEKRDQLGEKVVDMFKEKEQIIDSKKSSQHTVSHTKIYEVIPDKKKVNNSDTLPPPPPPMF